MNWLASENETVAATEGMKQNCTALEGRLNPTRYNTSNPLPEYQCHGKRLLSLVKTKLHAVCVCVCVCVCACVCVCVCVYISYGRLVTSSKYPVERRRADQCRLKPPPEGLGTLRCRRSPGPIPRSSARFCAALAFLNQ